MDDYTKFVLKSIWLFLLGALLAVVGLLCMLYRPDMGSNSFTIMLMGLFFTGAGSIYGKKKLGYGGSMISTTPERQKNLGFSMEDQSRFSSKPPFNRHAGQHEDRSFGTAWKSGGFGRERAEPRGEPIEMPAERDRPPTEDFLEIAEESMETMPSAEPPVQTSPVMRPREEPVIKKPAAGKPPITDYGDSEIPVKSGKGKILKIVVCPSCGAENEADDRFCYKCGFRIKIEKKKAKRAKKPKAAVKVPSKKSIPKPASKPAARKKPAAKKIVKKPAEPPTKKETKKPAKKQKSAATEPEFPGIDI